MEYQIALPPELEITPGAFVAAWNADPHSHAAGAARLGQAAPQQYDLGAVIELVLISLTVSISTNAFHELLKARLLAGGVRKRTRLDRAAARRQPPAGGDDRRGIIRAAWPRSSASGSRRASISSRP